MLDVSWYGGNYLFDVRILDDLDVFLLLWSFHRHRDEVGAAGVPSFGHSSVCVG